MFNAEKHVKKALEKVYSTTGNTNYHRESDINDLRFVVFSDQHKGVKDGADDFKNNENTYITALKYYSKEKYNLFLLGDVEELWECRPKNVLNTYENIFKHESEFANNNRYLRMSGNHDDYWESNRKVRKHLSQYLGGEIYRENMCESLMIDISKDDKELGQLLIVHGHQGTLFSDFLSFISKPVLRYIYRPLQRFFRFGYTTPANNFELRKKHEKWMHGWASEKDKLILIAGHTHHPVFVSESHEYFLKKEMENLEAQFKEVKNNNEKSRLQDKIKTTKNRLKEKIAEADGVTFEISPGDKPCYFNSGCCSFSDGDITGIEVERNQIRLVRWSSDKLNRTVLREGDLISIFSHC